ncbi:MAG: lysophospholipid acyltransferase family protein [Chitinophagales bacterium]
MQWLFTQLGILFTKIISLVPFSLMRTLSDIFYFFINRIYAFRKTIITINLMNALPDKRSEELWFIRTNFYRHWTDLFFEWIKTISISKNDLKEHIQLHHESYALLKQLEQKNQPIFILMAHYGNWKWAQMLFGLDTTFDYYCVHEQTKNKTYFQFLKQLFSQVNAQLVVDANTIFDKPSNNKKNKMIAILADENPSTNDAIYSTKLMNIKTDFSTKYIEIAQQQNAIILYASVQKLNRMYYEIKLDTITENAESAKTANITDKLAQLIEKDVLYKPEYWNWSWKKWKLAGI